MTTIAVRDGVMAADTLGDQMGKRAITQKLFRADGAVIGICGYWSDAKVFVDWYIAGANMANPPEWRMQGDEKVEFQAVVLTAGGIDWWSYSLVPERMRENFWSIGSGSQSALAAMHLGCGAEEAVSIAIKVDPTTGGDVETMELVR